MSFGDWVLLAAIFASVATAWATIKAKVAVLKDKVQGLERNHIPTLAARLDDLPCEKHLTEIVQVTTRLEAVAARLERLEDQHNRKEA